MVSLNCMVKCRGRCFKVCMHLPIDEVPITAITNGVHARSCVATSRVVRSLPGTKLVVAPVKARWERLEQFQMKNYGVITSCRLDMVVAEHLVKLARSRCFWCEIARPKS